MYKKRNLFCNVEYFTETLYNFYTLFLPSASPRSEGGERIGAGAGLSKLLPASPLPPAHPAPSAHHPLSLKPFKIGVWRKHLPSPVHLYKPPAT